MFHKLISVKSFGNQKMSWSNVDTICHNPKKIVSNFLACTIGGRGDPKNGIFLNMIRTNQIQRAHEGERLLMPNMQLFLLGASTNGFYCNLNQSFTQFWQFCALKTPPHAASMFVDRQFLINFVTQSHFKQKFSNKPEKYQHNAK